jgi:hypothetical protein
MTVLAQEAYADPRITTSLRRSVFHARMHQRNFVRGKDRLGYRRLGEEMDGVLHQPMD